MVYKKMSDESDTSSVEGGVVDEIQSLDVQKRKLFPVNDVMSDESDTSSVESGVVDEIQSLDVQKRKLFPVNNVDGIEEKLNDIQLKLDWVEKLDITINIPETEKKNVNVDTEAEDDFKREMSFYNQALAGTSKAFKRLKKLGIPTKRPNDYFAEMAKSDAHMLKVRKKLLSKQTIIEKSEKARAIREQKKQGKKVQREIIQQRKDEKQKMINALKKTKKGKMGADKLLGEKYPNPKNKLRSEKSPSSKKLTKSQRKRDYRDSKYGYGGKKKGSKYNTADSSAEFPGNKSRGGNKNKSLFNKKQGFDKKRPKSTRRRR